MITRVLTVLMYLCATALWADTFPQRPLKGSIAQIHLETASPISDLFPKLKKLSPDSLLPFWQLLPSEGVPPLTIHVFKRNDPAIQLHSIPEEGWAPFSESLKSLGTEELSKQRSGYTVFNIPFFHRSSKLVKLKESALIMSSRKLKRLLKEDHLFDQEAFKWAWPHFSPSSAQHAFQLNFVVNHEFRKTEKKVIDFLTQGLGLHPIDSLRILGDLTLTANGNLNLNLTLPHVRSGSLMEKLIAPRRVQAQWASEAIEGERFRMESTGWPMADWLNWIRQVENNVTEVFGEEFERELKDLNRDFGRPVENWMQTSFHPGLIFRSLKTKAINQPVFSVRAKARLHNKELLEWMSLLDFKSLNPPKAKDEIFLLKDVRGRNLCISRPKGQDWIHFLPLTSSSTTTPFEVLDALKKASFKRAVGGQRLTVSKEALLELGTKAIDEKVPLALRPIFYLALSQIQENLTLEHYANESSIHFHLSTKLGLSEILPSIEVMLPQ